LSVIFVNRRLDDNIEAYMLLTDVGRQRLCFTVLYA